MFESKWPVRSRTLHTHTHEINKRMKKKTKRLFVPFSNRGKIVLTLLLLLLFICEHISQVYKIIVFGMLADSSNWMTYHFACHNEQLLFTDPHCGMVLVKSKPFDNLWVQNEENGEEQ